MPPLAGTSDGRVHIWTPVGGGREGMREERRGAAGAAAAGAAHAMIDNA